MRKRQRIARRRRLFVENWVKEQVVEVITWEIRKWFGLLEKREGGVNCFERPLLVAVLHAWHRYFPAIPIEFVGHIHYSVLPFRRCFSFSKLKGTGTFHHKYLRDNECGYASQAIIGLERCRGEILKFILVWGKVVLAHSPCFWGSTDTCTKLPVAN